MQAFMVTTIKDRLIVVDTHIDSFELGVQKILRTSRYNGPTEGDLVALGWHLAALIPFQQIVPPMPVVDLFFPEESSQPFLRKIPRTNGDPDTVRLHTGLTKEQELEFIMRQLR